MNLNERNYAGDHVVVGSLEVLGDIKGGNIKQIRRNIDLIQQQAEVINRTQERYWEELSSDSMITPLEKQQLLKEIKSIQQSYTAIYSQALSIGQESSEYVQDYIATYNDLYSYLYTVLHLFDDMTTVTNIENRQTFNQKFYNYYYSESFVLVALSKGLLDSVSIRVLDSLLDEGEEGDVGIYHGALYQYVNGAWKNVSTGNYKGALSTLPLTEQDAFFLASDNFIVSQELWVNGQQLQINDGGGLDALLISRVFRKGYIYYCQDGAWFEQTDKTNYMYVAAFADVLNITGELPQIFQDAIDDLQQQIDANRVPKYRGPSATNPLNPVEDDFFVYSGTTTVTRRNSDIYQYRSGEWVRLDPLQSQNSPYYMQALDDILQLNNADNGYFAALFAQALFANNAFLYALSSKIITLREGGYIKTDNHSQENAGFMLDYDGNIDANRNTHIKGKVAIGVPLSGNTDFNTYDCVIGGNTRIWGNAVFEGQLKGGDVYCRKLGFYQLAAGDYTAWIEKISYSSTQSIGTTTVRKYRFTPCCYSSSIRVYVAHTGAASGDSRAHPTVALGIYIKVNGSVSTVNYDYGVWQAFNSGYSGTYYTVDISRDINFNTATDYVEVLFTYATDGGGYIPPRSQIQMKLSANNPLAGRFAVFEDIT